MAGQPNVSLVGYLHHGLIGYRPLGRPPAAWLRSLVGYRHHGLIGYRQLGKLPAVIQVHLSAKAAAALEGQEKVGWGEGEGGAVVKGKGEGGRGVEGGRGWREGRGGKVDDREV
eukprot:356298-Chlamydomonas_euryale.AAC.3